MCLDPGTDGSWASVWPCSEVGISTTCIPLCVIWHHSGSLGTLEAGDFKTSERQMTHPEWWRLHASVANLVQDADCINAAVLAQTAALNVGPAWDGVNGHAFCSKSVSSISCSDSLGSWPLPVLPSIHFHCLKRSHPFHLFLTVFLFTHTLIWTGMRASEPNSVTNFCKYSSQCSPEKKS